MSERELSAGLSRAEPVAVARGALGEDADSTWIVGGAVRDAIAGRPVVDLDLAVSANEESVARRIADACGGFAFELSAEFGTWRALARDRSWHVDVSRLRGETITADLGRRDFTVNAIAVGLGDLDAPAIDPQAGIADLRAGVLRAMSAESFSDDSLRVLRAARLAAEIGLELEPRTASLARASVPAVSTTAGERQFTELRLLVTGPAPLAGLALLDELDATAVVLPELAALRGVGQNRNHHLDVHGHTLEVLAQLLEVEADLDRYVGKSAGALRELLAEPLADELTRGGALRFGALLHDAGKPATRTEHEGGLVSFLGHDREGVAVVRGACARLKTSRVFSRHLEALTLHHLHLGFMTAERPLSRRRLYDYLRLTEPVAADVTMLTVADRLSARGTGPTATPEIIEAHLELAREVLPDALSWHADGPPSAPLPGDELAAAVGIEPGPQLGRLLAEVEAAVFAGEVSSRDDAIRVARAVVADG